MAEEEMEIWEKYVETDKSDFENFELKIPEFLNYGFDIIDEHARRTPTKTALIWANETGIATRKFSFDDIAVLSNKFGNVLNKYDFQKGDFALLMLPRIPEWHIAMLGMIKTGVIPIPSVTMLTSKDIEYRINKIQAKAVITDDENASKVEEILEKCPSVKTLILIGEQREHWINFRTEMTQASITLKPLKTKSNDNLVGYFTSGTTGKPKIVLHKQSYSLAHIVTVKFWEDLKPDDIHWATSDTGWAKSAWGLFGQWIIGATIFMHNPPRKFAPKAFLEILQNYKITNLCSTPTIYKMLTAENLLKDLRQCDLNNLRYCTSVGEPLNSSTMEVWEKETGLLIYDGWGQTESVNGIANKPGMPVKFGLMGRPTPLFDIRIVDDNGNELQPDEIGNIAIKVKPNHPIGLFDSYYKDAEKTQEVFRGDYYFTGDLGTKDKDGYILFVGRKDDVITSRGYRIGPFEVENALISHPAVVEAAAVGSPDELEYEKVKAFIVLTPGYKPSETLIKELQKHARKMTAPNKYPKLIEFVDELPKTVSGKILRKELKKQEWERVEKQKTA